MRMVGVGDAAPEFSLPDQDRQTRSLKDLRGRKVVLAFFPGAFTSVCTKELCTFRDSLSRLKELKAEVVAISVNDPFTLKGFADMHNLQFPLLSDYSREVSRRYGGVHEDFAGLKGYTASKRAVFIIDGEGVVRYSWVSDNPLLEPDYDEISRELEKIG